MLMAALLEGEIIPGFPVQGDPLSLAGATIYLPTQRACRLARDAFLDVIDGHAAILPRIIPIGDLDEDEAVFAQAATGALAEPFLDLPEAIGGIERKLLLAELIRAWAAQAGVRTEHGARLVAGNPASILALADDLAHLIDDVTRRNASWDDLDKLIPEEMGQFWQQTLTFLKIARDQWPKIREARGAIEPAELQNLKIEAEIKNLGVATGPVIAAGSTGSTPSTAALLATIARLPHGAVILPGLDTDLDASSWDQIDGGAAYGHPQFAMQGLLKKMGIARDAVTLLGAPAVHGREKLLSEALRPAEATDRWREKLKEQDFTAHADAAMTGLSVMQAANAEDEALGIAIALRETVDDGTQASRTRTAALITPDRALARRVVAALARWDVPVDDSGGDALADTPAGIFARLAAEVALGGVEPIPLLALLKHPRFTLAGRDGTHGPAVETLERAVLRGPRPGEGTAGLKQALRELREQWPNLYRNDPRKALTESDIGEAENFIERFAAAIAPLEMLDTRPLPVARIAMLHREVVAALSARTGASAAFSDADGKELDAFFSSLKPIEDDGAFPVTGADYPEAFDAALAGWIVRRAARPESRVRIYGLLEARLQHADRVVLGGLVEGIWPPDPRPDPWLSRPMRHDLGLDLPERRIGLSAHDFAQALGSKEVVLSSATKREGAPTVTSRFLQRLAAVAGDERWKEAQKRGSRYLAWGRSLDEPTSEPTPCPRPEPRPPREARPSSLSVTEIEDLLRDPYTIYAKHILNLRALDPVDVPPGASDRGSFIHKAIGDFSERYAAGLPSDPLKELLAIGREAFAEVEAYPDARAFWWPRFERIARWFVDWEQSRRANTGAVFAEIPGAYEFPVGERTFRLRTRADRIERLNNGSYAILDFKTGQPPGNREVAAGLAPQLTLEAAILRNGGFKGIAAGGSVAELSYVRLSGGEPAGADHPREFKDSTPDQEADKALANLRHVAGKFEDPDEAYTSFSRPQWVGRTYSDYDHLARVKEWSATGGETESGE